MNDRREKQSVVCITVERGVEKKCVKLDSIEKLNVGLGYVGDNNVGESSGSAQ